MKIAIVLNSFPSFSETFLINKVIFLAKDGVKVDVVRLQSSGNKQLYQLYKFDTIANLNIVDLNLPVTKLQIFNFVFQRPSLVLKLLSFKNIKQKLQKAIQLKALNVLQEGNYDIVHFEYSGIAVSYLDVISKLKCCTVVSCRGSAEKVKPLTQPERKEKLKQVFDIVDAIHCVSEDMKNTIAPYCNDLSKVFVNRPAIDASFFTPNKSLKNNDEFNILTIGRFTFQKGYTIGLLAIKKMVQKGYNLKWNIIGEGECYEEIVFNIHTLQLQNHVFLLGKKNKNEVNEWINKSDVFLLTSVYEGIPNVVLEAMAMELPVVTTRCGGVDEVIEHGIDGMITELYDIDKIAEYLEFLMNNASERERMGKLARQKILNAFTLQRQVNVFREAYNKLINID